MVLTEEQAREKWCPFVRTMAVTEGNVAASGFNRVAQLPDTNGVMSATCIGSACMAWRKMPDDFDRVFVPALADAWGPSPGPEWVLSATAHASDRNGPGQYWAKRRDDRGYCGLAGRPE